MKEIIDMMYDELKILEKQFEAINEKISNENNEIKRNKFIKLKQKIYDKITTLENDIDEIN